MYVDKDLVEDKLYKFTDQFNERKINHRDFILHYSTIYIYFMIEMARLVRYYLLPIPVRGYK